jgi:hypothetical protein
MKQNSKNAHIISFKAILPIHYLRVKLPLFMPGRHIGVEEVKLPSFLTSAIHGGQ